MTTLTDLLNHLDQLLVPDTIKDYCPNGLQVEGRATVKKIISGVTACQQLIDAAVAAKADALLVHHGYFWKNESPVITGMKRARIAQLLQHDISLLAYHLPLDIHLDYGNNVQLAQRLDLEVTAQFEIEELPLGFLGRVQQPMTADAFAQHLAERLQRKPLHIAVPNRATINTVAWCTGGAQNYITQAAQHDVDAYISGEISESTVHVAREMGLHYFAAGHHATERYGVQALGEHLAEHFGLAHQFVDIDNPA